MAARMRTIAQTVRYFKQVDPETCISEWYLRQLVRTKKIKCHMAGNKYLINIDCLEKYLENPPDTETTSKELGIIRRVQ